ncbi:hypothetical protein AMS68_007332 [Peltaster fructicola]|uniref:Uncharacterized protein n=1 Tax=Peltaster fructicola TaxID=286661 RepID=A0A6H0Y4G2_9PEZI|nr:hypothetical protein AMS68_007332 [Peltaster fructicola]
MRGAVNTATCVQERSSRAKAQPSSSQQQRLGVFTTRMYALAILAAFAATLAVASPLPQTSSSSADDIRYSVDLKIITSAPGQPEEYTVISAELNHLAAVSVYPVYRIEFVPGGVNENVDDTKVECRAYKDSSAQEPGSAPFNYKSAAYISTTGVSEGEILCYRVTDGEAAKF